MLASKHTSLRNLFFRFMVLLLLGCLLPIPAAQAKGALMDGAQDQLLSQSSTWDSNDAAVAVNNYVQDPSFESSFPDGPDWESWSQNFGSAICTLEKCGNGGGTAGPRTGAVWVWFGGVSPQNETARVSQSVTFPGCGAKLQFYLWIGAATAGSDTNDRFVVSIDNQTVFTANATQKNSYRNYTPVSIDVHAFANGKAHVVKFQGYTSSQLVTFNLDDVKLMGCPLISGNAGTAGATLKYTGGTATADASGNYSIRVPFGWSGTVTPSKTSHVFSPASRQYTNLLSDQSGQNYTATRRYTIAGNTGVGGVRFEYTDGAAKTAFSQANGNYSLTLPGGWTGILAPLHECFAFAPANQGYNNLASDHLTENYTPIFNSESGCADIDAEVAGASLGRFGLLPGASTQASFSGVNAGPVKIASSNEMPVIAAERLIYKVGGLNTSFSEMMALPDGQVDRMYWLPWYNHNGRDLDTQLRLANISSETAEVQVFIGDLTVPIATYNLQPGETKRENFPGVNAGPVKIVSSQDIVAAERLIYKVENANTSFAEMMALPNKQVDKTYWLPWYNDNGKDLDTQLRIANVSGLPANVDVFIGNLDVPLKSFTLEAGKSERLNFTGVNAGPVKIASDQNIVAAERLIYKVGGVSTSFAEMMALPAAQADKIYWLPWYNNVGLDTQLRIANVSGLDATVTVTIGGVPMDPLALPAGKSERMSFPANAGPVRIESTQNIVVAERLIYRAGGVNTSFSEMMALPAKQLDTMYWLPWYNNNGNDLDTQLRFGVP